MGHNRKSDSGKQVLSLELKKDQASAEKDQAVTERDQAVTKKGQAIAERDQAMTVKGQAMADKNQAMSERDGAVGGSLRRWRADAIDFARNLTIIKPRHRSCLSSFPLYLGFGIWRDLLALAGVSKISELWFSIPLRSTFLPKL